MGKRNVKLRYKDMLAIKHALMASVAAKKSMIEKLTNREDSALDNLIERLQKDIEHEEELAKFLATEARLHVGGEK